MPSSKFVETETHICNQIRYKVLKMLTGLHSIEKVMDTLLKDNDPGNIKKIVIQPKEKIGESYASCPSSVIKDDVTPWVKSKPWKEHNRIHQCSNL